MSLEKNAPPGQKIPEADSPVSENVRRLTERTTSLFDRLQITGELTSEDERLIRQKMLDRYGENVGELAKLDEKPMNRDQFSGSLVSLLRKIAEEPFGGLLAREAVRLYVNRFSSEESAEEDEDRGIHPIVGDTWSVERRSPHHFAFHTMGSLAPRLPAESSASSDMLECVRLFSRFAETLSQAGADTFKFRQLLGEVLQRFPALEKLLMPANSVPNDYKKKINPDAAYFHEFPKGALIAKLIDVDGVPSCWIEYYSNDQLEAMRPKPKAVMPTAASAKNSGIFGNLRKLLGMGK